MQGIPEEFLKSVEAQQSANQRHLVQHCPLAAVLVPKAAPTAGNKRAGEVTLNRRAERLLGYRTGQLHGTGQWLNALFQGNNGWHARKQYEAWKQQQAQLQQQDGREGEPAPVFSSVFSFQVCPPAWHTDGGLLRVLFLPLAWRVVWEREGR